MLSTKLIRRYLTLLSILLTISCTKQSITLQEGDLLFKQQIDDTFSEAIVSSTTSIGDYKFNHVGVALCEQDEWFVVEAITKGVSKTTLNEFLGDSSIVVVARLLPEYTKDIPSALDNVKRQIGKPYDNFFSHNNDAYYCSELIQLFFLHDGLPIFTPIRMTFRDKETGEFPTYWQEHFTKLNTIIPEGELGSNPGDLSKSDKIMIIGKINP